MNRKEAATIMTAMALIAETCDFPRYADMRDFGSAGRRPKSNHQSESCVECRKPIGPGRRGRKCKKCRGDQ